MNPIMVDCNQYLRSDLTRKELELLIEEVIDPFYRAVKNDPDVAAFIPDEKMLFELKRKNAMFVISFLLKPSGKLREEMGRITHSHKRIHLPFHQLSRYFLFWSELVLQWIANHATRETEELCRWRAKLFQLFFVLSAIYFPEAAPAPESAPPAASSPEERTGTVDLSKIHGMHVEEEAKISAAAYIEEYGDDPDTAQELEELEQEIRDLFYTEEQLTPPLLERGSKIIAAFVRMLERTMEFKELAYALSSLTTILAGTDPEKLDEKTRKKVYLFLNAIIEDLAGWRQTVYVTRETVDIHYLDASLFSSCAQLEVLIHSMEGPEEEEELELF